MCHCFTESSCQHLISTSVEINLNYEKMDVDEQNAYIDVLPVSEQPEDLDEYSDDEDINQLYGFTKSDSSIMLSLNRSMDLGNFYRDLIFRTRSDTHWYPNRSTTPFGKRNYADVINSVYSTCATDKTTNTGSFGVPKRRRH